MEVMGKSKASENFKSRKATRTISRVAVGMG